MKTITEFFGLQLIESIKKVEELAVAGKTPEEMLQLLGETFKLEGEKF